MRQRIYRSLPFGFDRATLAGILVQARRNNQRDDITGALICRQDLYIQLIEGPEAAIEALYARITRDDRHCDVELVLDEEVSERMFARWAMLDDAQPSMTWSPEQVAEGAVEQTSPDALRRMFQAVALKAEALADPN